MAKKRELCRDKRGIFVRNLGWKKTATGYTQQKFYLGRDQARAKIASLKLEQIWDALCRRWERLTPEVLRPRYDPSLSSPACRCPSPTRRGRRRSAR